MYRLLTVLFILISAIFTSAQNSNFISWEGKAVNSSGQLITNQQINVQVALRFGSPTAIASYVENHTPTTNAEGVFRIMIGDGAPIAGSYDDSPWGSGKSYAEIFANGIKLKTEEVHSPRNYTQFGNTRVNRSVGQTNTHAGNIDHNVAPILKISVGNKTLIAGEGISFTGEAPNYKINSTNKITITAEDGLEITGKYPNFKIGKKKHYLGEKLDGGIVFVVSKDGQHGLIAKSAYSPTTWVTFPWGERNSKEILPKDFQEFHCNSADGAYNTMVMLMKDKYNNIVDIGEPLSIPQTITYGEWYIPSINELRLAYKNKDVLKDVLNLGSNPEHIFWSSSEGGIIYQGHGDAPDGGNFPKGKYFKDKNGNTIKYGRDHIVGVACIDFFTGRDVTISKAYSKPFFLVKKF